VYQSQQASIPTPTPTSLPSADVLNEDSLNFVEIGSGITASSQTSSSLTTLSTITGAPQSAALTRDDSIPPPPDDLEPRAPVTPIPMAPTLSPEEEKQGDVLSVQSLRELLLPGKSNANQTVVVINLLSTLAFLVILTILILRMVAISRKNRVKARHMKELITGEISVLEGKFKTANEADSGYREELERLKEELEKV
jgi:hypothetical protein